MAGWASAGVVALLLAAGGASAQMAERIDLADVGLYSVTRSGDAAAPKTEIKFYQQTTRVPARIGVRFGIRFSIGGSPVGRRVALDEKWTYPAPGLRNPKTGTTTVGGTRTVQTAIGENGMRGYSFDNDWELVPGAWTIELSSGGRKLLSQTFTVFKP
jgi:hypothetical protein